MTRDVPAGTLVIHDRVIVSASVGAAALVGREIAVLVGRPFVELLVPEDRARIAEQHERRLRGEPTPGTFETEVVRADGRRRVVEFEVSTDGVEFVFHLRDVSAEARLRARLAALARLGAEIQAETSEAAVFARVRDGLYAAGLSSLLIRGLDDGVRVEWARLPAPLADGFAARLGHPLTGYHAGWTPFARAAWTGGAAYTDDWVVHAAGFVGDPHAAPVRDAAATYRLTRAAAVRIDERAGPRFYLVMVGDWPREGDLPALRLFGAQIAAALDAARAIADLSRRNAELAALNRLGELAADATDLQAFLRSASEIVVGSVECAVVTTFRVDEAAGELVREFDMGLESLSGPEPRIPIASPIGSVIPTRTATFAGLDDLPPHVASALGGLGLTAFAWVPLIARSSVVGVMALAWRTLPADPERRLALLQSMGAHLAGTMESHALLGDLRRRVGELTLLNDVAMATATLDPVLLLEGALRRICDTFEAEMASAYLRARDGLDLVASRGIPDALARASARLAVGVGAPGLAVLRLAPVVTTDLAALDPASADFAAHQPVGAAVSVPLLAKSEALGALTLMRRDGRAFSEGDVRLLSAIAVQLGVTVENARLFADVRRRLQDLEAVHALALRIFAVAPGDVRAVLDGGCREVARALSAQAAAILLVDENGRMLRGAASHGTPLVPERIAIPLERDALAMEAIRTRAPVWSEDVTRDARSALRGHPDIPALSMLAVPLTARDRVRGVLYLADARGRPYGEADRALAVALAGELAVGIENAELYAEARRRVEELSLLNEVGRTVAGSLDLGRVLRDGADAVRRLVDATHCFVVLYDPERQTLRLGAGSGEPVAAGALRAQGKASGRDLAALAVRERRVVAVEDAATSADVNPAIVEALGIKSALAAPMLLRGEPVGVVIVDETRRTRRFDEAEIGRVMAVANQLAVAIDNARLYGDARDRLAELGTVIDVARVVSSTLELDQVLEAGAEHLKRTLDASGCTILLADHPAATLRRAAVRGVPLEAAAVPLATPSLARDALDAGEPRTGAHPPDADWPGGAAILAVPLHARGEPVGVALVSDARADRTFSGAEISRAAAIASQLAVAVDNARLYSETRRRAEELGLLHEVGRSLVESLEPAQVLDVGARNLARIVDATDAYLSLADPSGRELVLSAVAGAHAGHLGRRIPIDPDEGRLAAIVFQRREPVVIADAVNDPRLAPAWREGIGARAFLGLPLVVRDRTIGSVVIVETRGPRQFTPAEVERAAAIANQLAVAVENARLYEDLRRSYADLARAQQRLIAQERLAALGELSAVVAHEVRNPLGVIFNSLGSLRRLVRPTGDAKMLLDIVGEEADRLNRIVGDLLDFARPSTPVVRPERIERIADEAIATALAGRPQEIAVTREVEPDLPAVPMDARLVRQAVVNVAVNAVQAMPRGGRLALRIAREDASVVLVLKDTGGGIPEEVRPRIFEPFFTTKASGTGLGLAVVKRILDGHGGDIAIRSEPGVGTAFTLRFPLVPPVQVEKDRAIG